MGRNFAGRVIPPIESSQLALVVKEPMGVVACIVPWNYPLLLLAWKLAPALAAGNACVCKPSELTPLSTLALAELLRAAARRRGQPRAGRRRRRRADRRGPARGLRGVHRLGRDRPADRAHLHRPRRAHQPRARRQGPVHRLRRRRGGDRGRRARRRVGGVPQLRPGVHVGGALLRRPLGLRRLPVRVRRPRALAARRRPARRRHRHGPDGQRGAAREGRAPARGGGRRGRGDRVRRRPRGPRPRLVHGARRW